MSVQAVITPDRGGRPPNLQRRARALLRQRGVGWLEEAQRQADLGDLAAMRLVLDLAHFDPAEADAPSVRSVHDI